MDIRNIIHIAIEIWGSVFCVLAAICMAAGKEEKYLKHKTIVKLLIGSSILGLCDAMAWFYRGNETTTGYYMVRISNYFVFVLFYLYGVFAGEYLLYCLDERKVKLFERPKWFFFCRLACIACIVMFTINLAHPFLYDFDATNHYYRLAFFPISQAVGIVIILVFLFHVFGNVRKLSDEETISCLSLSVLPVMALIVTIAYYGVSLTYLSMMGASVACFVAYCIERAKLNDRRHYELRERETALMMSQVTPHFIFNSLAAIRGQILEDPDEAYDTIGEFARYLRSNLNSKRLETNITLEEELDTTWVYIKLEKLRLGEKLQIDLDVENDQVKVPAMSIQTMVENAIKHGIKPKGEGNILISEREEDGYHVIRVKDDGVGFDIETLPSDGKEHIGVYSTKERIRYSCNGRMEINSAVGEGTEVSFYIPMK